LEFETPNDFLTRDLSGNAKQVQCIAHVQHHGSRVKHVPFIKGKPLGFSSKEPCFIVSQLPQEQYLFAADHHHRVEWGLVQRNHSFFGSITHTPQQRKV
jgi:hypothetical protein